MGGAGVLHKHQPAPAARQPAAGRYSGAAKNPQGPHDGLAEPPADFAGCVGGGVRGGVGLAAVGAVGAWLAREEEGRPIIDGEGERRPPQRVHHPSARPAAKEAAAEPYRMHHDGAPAKVGRTVGVALLKVEPDDETVGEQRVRHQRNVALVALADAVSRIDVQPYEQVEDVSGDCDAEEGSPGQLGRPVRAHLLKRVQDASEWRVEGGRHSGGRPHADPHPLPARDAEQQPGHRAEPDPRQQRRHAGTRVHHGPLTSHGQPGGHHQRDADHLGNHRARVQQPGHAGAVEVGLERRQARQCGARREVRQHCSAQDEEEVEAEVRQKGGQGVRLLVGLALPVRLLAWPHDGVDQPRLEGPDARLGQRDCGRDAAEEHPNGHDEQNRHHQQNETVKSRLLVLKLERLVPRRLALKVAHLGLLLRPQHLCAHRAGPQQRLSPVRQAGWAGGWQLFLTLWRRELEVLLVLAALLGHREGLFLRLASSRAALPAEALLCCRRRRRASRRCAVGGGLSAPDALQPVKKGESVLSYSHRSRLGRLELHVLVRDWLGVGRCRRVAPGGGRGGAILGDGRQEGQLHHGGSREPWRLARVRLAGACAWRGRAQRGGRSRHPIRPDAAVGFRIEADTTVMAVVAVGFSMEADTTVMAVVVRGAGREPRRRVELGRHVSVGGVRGGRGRCNNAGEREEGRV
eukprot:scaffold2601_cov117-Isochrysis_galbana.AAC.7